jgi:dinuclear metal center YbgI/SA1388 family protein
VTDSRPPSLAELVTVVHRRYDPATAEPWDAVGLVCGDPEQPVQRILVALDPVCATVDEALEVGAQLLLTHHPLLFAPVTSLGASPEGLLVQRLVRSGVALLAAHTNADIARDGVSDALAAALGLTVLRPLVASVVDPGVGVGRVGTLAAPTSLRSFAERVRDALPETAQGVRVAGDLDAPVGTVAVWGGSGAEALVAAAAAGVDVLVTSDLKHHQVLSHRQAGGPAVIDVAHVASEGPWVPWVAQLLRDDLAALGLAAGVLASRVTTDPWDVRL